MGLRAAHRDNDLWAIFWHCAGRAGTTTVTLLTAKIKASAMGHWWDTEAQKTRRKGCD